MTFGGSFGDQSAVRFTARGRTGGAADFGLQYPSPFFDIAQTYLPSTVKQMFRWCRYYFLVHPLINAVVSKMAEYPITDILFDTERLELKEKWQEFLLDQLRYRAFQIEVGLDHYTYGNALVSIFYPFIKMLECGECHYKRPAKDCDYRFQNNQFYTICPKCSYHGPSKAYDRYIKAPKGIRLLRWNPEDVDIRYNDISGEYEYYYQIPVQLRNDILIGKKSTVESVPQLFIDALRLKKSVVFSRDNIFHFKRPTLAGKDRGWGTPMILPVLKDTFYLQVLRKAQEAIALEHIVPLRILFPQAGSASSDPYSSVNLQDWRDQVAGEIRRWRCVSPESLVETREGLRLAGEISVGDWLKNRNGVFERVIKRHERPLDPGEMTYRLRVRGQHAIQTVYSEEHPIWSAKKINNGNGHKLGVPGFYRVDTLSVGDYVGYPTGREIQEVKEIDLASHVDRAATKDWVYVDHIDTDVPEAFEYLLGKPSLSRNEVLEKYGWGLNAYKTAQNAIREGRTLRRIPRRLPVDEELAYVLGVYAAEGNTTPKAVYFSLHRLEIDMRDTLDRFFAKRFGAERTGGEKTENGVQYAYSSVVAAQLFHSLLPGISTGKRLPELIRHAPAPLALAALRGVIEGDGSYYSDKMILGVSSRQLAEDVRQLLLSLQIMPGISYTPGGPTTICGIETKGHGCYRVQVSGDQYKHLSALLYGREYQGTDLCRIGLFRDGYAWFRIEAIEEAEADSVIAFQMEGDGTFCTWGVATHNSDNNYIPIMPLPIGNQTIGGDGRALLLSQEIRVWSEQIVAGMGIPVELIFGGLSFSGSNVSLRMLENTFLGYLQDHRTLLKWIIKNTSAYLGWSPVKSRFKPFKMADDLQRKAYLFQLNQANKLSDESLLADADYDSTKEDMIMERESTRRVEAQKKRVLQDADMQGEAQMVATKWQMKQQDQQMKQQMATQTEAMKEQMSFQGEQQKQMMGDQMAMQQGQPPGETSPEMQPAPRHPELLEPPPEIQSPLTARSIQPYPPNATGEELMGRQNVDLLLMGRQLADRISNLPPQARPQALMSLKAHQPELHDVVLGLMVSGGPTRAAAAAARPLPEQKPARRGPESQLV